MIQQMLNKNLLQDLTEALQREVTWPVADRRSLAATPMDDFNAGQQADLAQALKVAQRELANSAPASSDERRGEAELSIQDAKAYMARSPEVSNLQSAAEAYFLGKRSEVIKQSSPNDRRGGATSLGGLELSILPEYLADRRVFGAFEQTDLRWIGSLLSEGLGKFRGRRPFVPRPVRKEPIPLPNENLRLVVVGDWGSGIPRAQKIGALMRRELDAPGYNGWQRHVIHLGDVYYSGWKYEYQDRFLKFWPVKPEEKDTIGSFNLNGNHDMYSGGWDYFDFALADERFAAWQGTSSLFSLANSRWQLFGLDTSYSDAALAGDQPIWLAQAALPGRKSMLLSHHQFCSSFETASVGVIEAMTPVLAKLDVAAWLWGHEHRCMTFRDVTGIRYPACLGHGGVPVYQTHDSNGPLPAPGLWEYRDYVDGGLELWAKFGFVTLDFYGDKIEVRYINEDGVVHRSDTIS
jgi:hypothetical protein